MKKIRITPNTAIACLIVGLLQIVGTVIVSFALQSVVIQNSIISILGTLLFYALIWGYMRVTHQHAWLYAIVKAMKETKKQPLIAARYFRLALMAHPQQANWWFAYFVSCWQTTKEKNAMLALAHVLKLKPKNLRYRMIYAARNIDMGNKQTAAEVFEAIWREKPMAFARIRVATEGLFTLLEGEKYELVLAIAPKVIIMHPRLAAGHVARAEALLGLRRIGEALYECNRLTQLFQDAYQMWTVKGRAHLAGGFVSQALDAFSKALQINPNDVGALEGRAQVFLSMREYEKAQEIVQQIYNITKDKSFCQTLLLPVPENMRQTIVEG